MEPRPIDLMVFVFVAFCVWVLARTAPLPITLVAFAVLLQMAWELNAKPRRLLAEWWKARRARKAEQQTPLGEMEGFANFLVESERSYDEARARFPWNGGPPLIFYKTSDFNPKPPMTDQEFCDSFKKGSK